MKNSLDTEIKFLKGIGSVRAAQFNKLGVFTVGDLLHFFPRRYDDWKHTVPISEAPVGETVCIKAILSFAVSSYRTNKNMLISKTAATDGKGFVHITFFNNKYVGETLKEGEEYLFRGKILPDPDGGLMMNAPAFCPAQGADAFHAVYPQTAGLNSKAIAKAVKNALDSYSKQLAETLPPEILARYRLPGIAEAVRLIHFPENEDDIRSARRRLIYEELLVLQLGIGLSRTSTSEASPYIIDTDGTEEFFSMLPFAPTAAQRRSAAECFSDMSGGSVMRRLLQGDVGSGKTAVAAALIYSVAKNGFQSALMVPTEVLAAQHCKTFSRFFENTGINVELLTGSTGQSDRKRILAGLKDGTVDLVIGTHAVIGDKVEFNTLALAVTDEQHRFGVAQRAALRRKGMSPHILVMSATPIPRTLSMIIYGDLDISILDEKPAGRQDTETFAVDSGYRDRIYGFLKKQMDAGRQAYLVCPLVEDDTEPAEEHDGAELVSAQALYSGLSEGAFKGYSVGLMHGKMRPKEKEAVMSAFGEGRIQLLVCTVVIEVGIDVPNANTVVIENAERFGLSQLHQLRGRVGRGNERSYCILISDSQNETSLRRLSVMKETSDGFRIAEEDLKLRGPGDFFGSRQSGLPSLKIADLLTDSKILYAARDDAKRILSSDPELSRIENKNLKLASGKLFSDV